MKQPDSNGLYHPATEQDVIELIEYAIQNKLQVRVRGAAQSVLGGVYADGFNPAGGAFGNNINIELDQMRGVSINKEKSQATVGGGCNLGFDPFDPSGVSAESDSNNLFFLLNQAGLAIPNVPEAIHQTVAGFISTGSAAGSMMHSFDEYILSLKIVDGTGKVNTFTKCDNADDQFYGAVVSMGLLGIITEVTLQCVPAFNITGKQTITKIEDCEFDFFGPGDVKPSLQKYISDTEFSRLLWWPFQTLHRVISWKAKTMAPQDYNHDTGTPENFKPKPYQPLFPQIAGTRLISETVAATGFQLIASWPDWFQDILGNSAAGDSIMEKKLIKFAELAFPYAYPLLTDLFFPVNTPVNPPQVFWDNWLGSLPMDKLEFSNNLFNLTYSEMWVPVDKTREVVNAMQKFYTDKGYSATGFYTVDIIAAKKSPFWLSPAYGTDVIRINILYFENSKVKPNDYYCQFWKLLNDNDIPFRPHWGKRLPDAGYAPKAGLTGSFPKWREWLNLREQMDPHQIFVTDYWRVHLDNLKTN
jgi:D-arabinono-1,4-lactone oxidase